MNRRDVTLTLVTAMWVIAVSAALLKEFRLVSFDRAFAASQGWPISLIDIVLMSLVVMITIIGLQSVGLLLVVAFLIIPAAAARLWTDSFTTMVFLGGICGGLSGYGGAVASAIFPQLPTGAVIVLVATAIFFISLLIAPRRGILARILAHTRVTLRIVSDHFLREMYEACEDAWRQRLAETPWREVGLLAHQTGVSGWYGVSLTLLLYLRGDLELRLRAGSLAVRLSASGLERARHKVRNHRLWEQYLLSRTEVHLTHVDFSADVVEHFLSSEVISRLEEALQRRTTPSLEETVPQCPHSGGEV